MKKSNGFTLIESILYISLLAIFLGGVLQLGWTVVNSRTKSYVTEEVNQNLRLSLQRILMEIKSADSINSVSATSLSLSKSNASYNPTVISLVSGKIKIGYGSVGNCPIANPCDLTSNNVVVTYLNFVNLSSGKSKNVQTSLTIKFNSSSPRPEWQFSQSLTSSAEIRKI